MLASLKRQKENGVLTQASDYTAIRMLEIEIDRPLPDVSAINEEMGSRYQQARCLVRLHTLPIGIVDFPLGQDRVKAEEYAPFIWNSLQGEINEHLRQDGLPIAQGLDSAGLSSAGTPQCMQERQTFLTDGPFVSVIVSTRDRPDTLMRCLNSLLSLHYSSCEIIVVDNAPGTTATYELIEQNYRDVPRIRYIREDRPGLAYGRNCGMMAARGEILAFTDDDVVVDEYWLVELVRAFRLTADVACVTGVILPLELEVPVQLLFEQRGGSSRGLKQRIFDKNKYHVHLYRAGQFGSGASMAFTAAFLRSVNGFDPALGAGSRARSAEETAAFFQVIMRGYKLVYQPTALLYHPPYRHCAGLRKQIYGYGVGFTAYIMKSLIDNPSLLFALITKVPYDLLFRGHSSKDSKKALTYPRELTWLERKGMLYGPLAYLQGRWITRKKSNVSFH